MMPSVLGAMRAWLETMAPRIDGIAANGSRILLFYGEAKVGADGLYHVIPRTGPSLP